MVGEIGGVDGLELQYVRFKISVGHESMRPRTGVGVISGRRGLA